MSPIFNIRIYSLFIALSFFVVGCAQFNDKPETQSNNTIQPKSLYQLSDNPQKESSTQSRPAKAKHAATKEDVLSSEEIVIPATDQPETESDSESDIHIAEEVDNEALLPSLSAIEKSNKKTSYSVVKKLENMMPNGVMKAKQAPPFSNNVDVESIYFSPCVDIDCAQPAIPLMQDITEPESSPTQNEGDLWQRLRRGYLIDNVNLHKRTKVQLDWYASHPKYLERTFKRARNYLYYIVHELERRKMPTELALLPVVESAFDPFAYSHGRASGMWQFIPGTGRIFGLKQTWWYDGRRDITASTNAALDYLQALADRFDGDWLLALAAYNSGAGTVSKAIRKNKKRGRKTDFWSLNLPRETTAYAPKLMAIAKLVEHPLKYGIDLETIPDKPTFKSIKIGGQMDLAQAAKYAGVDIATLYQFNPGFNRWATSPSGPHHLLIPIEKADAFKSAISELSTKDRLTWKRYKIRRGDSIIKIAKHFNTTPTVIKQVNNLRNNRIRQGKYLLIPVASRGKTYYKLNANNRLLSKQTLYGKKSASAKVSYKVKPGDTLWDLSRKYKVGIRRLAKWNGMAPGDTLKPGKQLVIWTKNPIQAKTKTRARLSRKTLVRKIGYRVRAGDSLAKIAGKFNVSISKIANWNNLNRKKYLQPGQRLTLFVDVTDGS